MAGSQIPKKGGRISINCIHSGRLGDILYSVPACLSLAQQHNTSICYYLHPESAYDDLEDGRQLRLSNAAAASVSELLAIQPHIAAVKNYNGEDISVNFDWFRKLSGEMCCGDLARKYFEAFECWYPLDKPWLIAYQNDRYRGRVIINRTARYQSPSITYEFLKKYEPLFLGTEIEHEAFCKECPCERIHTNSMLDAANIINSCKFFVGNTSSCWAIAEGLKRPRVQENYKSNCIPNGGLCLDAVSQIGFEWSVAYVNERTK